MNLEKLNTNFSQLPKTFPDELRGQWVAMSEGKVIAHSEDFRELFKKIKEEGNEKRVLFHKVPTDDIIIV